MAEFDPYLTWLGIPAVHRPPSHYQLLGVDPQITDAAVIKALALQRIAYVRNFQTGEHASVCARILEELAAAEGALTNPETRAAYDRRLRAAAKVAPSVPAKAIAPKQARPAPPPEVEERPRTKRGSKRRNKELQSAIRWIGGGVFGLLSVVLLVWTVRTVGGSSQRAPFGSQRIAIRAVPAEVTVVVRSNNARLERQDSLFAIICDATALESGVDLSLSKPGFKTKSLKLDRSHANSAAPLEVALDVLPSRSAVLTVEPSSARVSATDGELTHSGGGRWTVAGPPGVETVSVVVSADGFTSKSLQLWLDGGSKNIRLAVALSDAMRYYASLGDDAALRLVGRVGAFAGSAGPVALSRNGKFLAIVERCQDPLVHVWDVDARRFVGRVIDTCERGMISRRVDSVAVSNDGRFVAAAYGCLSIFDIAKGQEVFRAGGETATFGAFHSVAFSADDAVLRAVVADGRIISYPVDDWESESTQSGFEKYAADVEFTGDGAAATARTPNGFVRWTRGKGSQILAPATEQPSDRFWSGRPNGKFFFAAARRGGWERRRCDDLDVVPDRGQESSPIMAIAALSDDAIALAVQRTPMRTGSDSPDGVSALRVRNAATNMIVGEVVYPSWTYRLTSSDDGALVAAVAEREQAVYLWQFNPRGRLTTKYDESTRWDPAPLRQWSKAIGRSSSKKVGLWETSPGVWSISLGDHKGQITEKSRDPYFIAFHGGDWDLLFFNNGHLWSRKTFREVHDRLSRPDDFGFEVHGAHRDSIGYLPHLFGWVPMFGGWGSTDQPVRTR